MFDLIAGYADWILGVSAAVVLVLAGIRKLRRKSASIVSKINLGFETLAGRDEIRHPETGVVLVEATPPLGKRVATIEGALVSLADTHSAIVALGGRVDSIDTKLNQHIADCPPTVNTVVVNPPH